MEKYQSYKSSGVEWIGEIPSSWDSEPLKYYFNYTKGSNGQRLTKTYIDENPGNYPVYSGMTENDGVLGFVNEFEFDYSFPLIFTTTVGSRSMTTKILNGKFSLSQNCLVMIRKKECNTSFIQYFLSFDFPFRKLLLPTIFQPSLRMEDLDRYKIIIPPLNEQHQIVQFLDKKTDLIDKLISTKERKITLLKEQRTSLINQVVTKGLNPNVKMKESGVEWIGEIPEFWNVFKMKYGVNHINEKGITLKDDVKISPENVESMTGVCFNYYSEYEGEGMKFKNGDVLLNKLRLYLKKIIFTEMDGFSMGEMIVLRCKENLFNRYFYYLIFHQGLIDLLDSQSNGVKLPRVSPEIILNSFISFPPINEQVEIVNYLDSKTKEIDNLVQLEQKKIDLLKDYRQSLISEVVTGKIKVTK